MRLVPALIATLFLAGCGSSEAPPLTGNVVDAHGAHAGSFHPAGSPAGDYSRAKPANAQDAR